MMNFSYSFYCMMLIYNLLLKDEVPSALMDAHVKNIEAATTDGKYDPAVGLLQVILY